MEKENKYIEDDEFYTADIMKACEKINEISQKYKSTHFPYLTKIKYEGKNAYTLSIERRNNFGDGFQTKKVVNSTMLSDLLVNYIFMEAEYDVCAEKNLVQIISEIEDDFILGGN